MSIYDDPNTEAYFSNTIPDMDIGDLSFADIGANLGADTNFSIDMGDLQSLLNNPELLSSFAALYPEEARLLQGLPSASEMADLEKQASADVSPGGIMSGNPFGTQTGGTRNQTVLEKLGIGSGSDGKGILGSGVSGTDALKYAAMIAAAKMAKDDAEAARKEARGAAFKSKAPVTATRQAYKGTKYAAQGGLMSLAQGGKTSLPPRYLNGHSDGMADKVPAQIDNRRPAALSDGEFVIPADVVSHLGNGNSSAGAKRLYEMMDRIRHARTGNPKQGKQINPDKFLPR